MAIKFGRPIEMRDAPRPQTALASTPLDLAIRPRRNRKAEWARRLVRENVLTTSDLIWPMFVVTFGTVAGRNLALTRWASWWGWGSDDGDSCQTDRKRPSR